MASQDFVKLMNLVYVEKYEIISFQYEFNKETGENVEITLKKNGDIKILSSNEKDFCDWAVRLHNVAKFDGTMQLFPIKDTEMYYRDIDHLSEEEGKINEAWKRVVNKDVTIDFDFDKIFNRLLKGDYSKHDDKFLKLKQYYWEILAIKMYEAKGILELKDKFKDPYFTKYYNIIERVIREALPFKGNLIKKYLIFND